MGIYHFQVMSVLELLLQLKAVWWLKWQSLWKKLQTASLKLEDSQTNQLSTILQVRHTAVQFLIQFYRLSLKQSTENEYLDSPSHHSFRMNRQLHCQTILPFILWESFHFSSLFKFAALIFMTAGVAVIPLALRVLNHWFYLALVVLVSACPCALIYPVLYTTCNFLCTYKGSNSWSSDQRRVLLMMVNLLSRISNISAMISAYTHCFIGKDQVYNSSIMANFTLHWQVILFMQFSQGIKHRE